MSEKPILNQLSVSIDDAIKKYRAALRKQGKTLHSLSIEYDPHPKEGEATLSITGQIFPTQEGDTEPRPTIRSIMNMKE